jgi:hypothetical protein
MESDLRSESLSAHPRYEPPLVERVISADEIAREVHYAGSIDPSGRGDLGCTGSYDCEGSIGV